MARLKFEAPPKASIIQTIRTIVGVTGVALASPPTIADCASHHIPVITPSPMITHLRNYPVTEETTFNEKIVNQKVSIQERCAISGYNSVADENLITGNDALKRTTDQD